ncbi:MAG TPA: sugar ABC transporter substrate-binding protein [Anaerolineales bacterium]|nr:sugar ABC transporter substrate-binding protein [Anaerolineales bacterium]
MLRKTIFNWMGILVLMAVMLSACAPAATPTPVVAAEPSGKVTLWMWKAAHDTLINSGVLDKFKEEYPDVEVEVVEYAPADVYQKLPLALQAGTGAPDISLVENSHLAQIVSLGGLTDMTEWVTPYLDKMNAYKWADAKLDDKYYAMPWDSGPVVLYYRRDVFEAAGLPSDPESVSEAVSTWDKYFDVCQTIMEKTGSACFSNNKANNYGRLYEMMLWQQGLGYYNAEGDVTVDSPENIATLETMKRFWDVDLTSDQLEWTDGWYAELAAETDAKPIATLVEAAWMGAFLKGWIAPGTEGKWGVALMPAMEEGQVRAANDGGSAFVIPEQSQNKEAAWALTEFLFGRVENQVAMFKSSDFFPSLEAAYADPVFSEPDPFFADQAVRPTYVEVVKEVPIAYVYGPHYPEMNGFVATAIQKVATGQASPADALKEAADAIRSQTGMT